VNQFIKYACWKLNLIKNLIKATLLPQVLVSFSDYNMKHHPSRAIIHFPPHAIMHTLLLRKWFANHLPCLGVCQRKMEYLMHIILQDCINGVNHLEEHGASFPAGISGWECIFKQ